MTDASKKAILKALIDAGIFELMVKTTGDQVYLDEKTTLTPKIAEMIEAINLRAKTEHVDSEIAAALTEAKSYTDTKAYSEASGALAEAKSYTDTEINALINGAPTTLDTLGELATAMSENEDIIKVLENAIGTKVNSSDFEDLKKLVNSNSNTTDTNISAALAESKSYTDEKAYIANATAQSLAYAERLNAVNEAQSYTDEEVSNALAEAKSYTDTNIKSVKEYAASASSTAREALTEAKSYTDEKVSAITEVVGTKADQTAVDSMQETLNTLGDVATKDEITEDDLELSLRRKVNAASEGNHSHENMETLDGITNDMVTAWNEKTKLYISETKPENLTSSGLWFNVKGVLS